MADERTPRRTKPTSYREGQTYTVGIDKNYARTYSEEQMREMGTEFPDADGNRVVMLEREQSDNANWATKRYYENIGYTVEDNGRQLVAKIPWDTHQDYLKKVQAPFHKMLKPDEFEGKDNEGFKYSVQNDGVVRSDHTGGETLG